MNVDVFSCLVASITTLESTKPRQHGRSILLHFRLFYLCGTVKLMRVFSSREVSCVLHGNFHFKTQVFREQHSSHIYYNSITAHFKTCVSLLTGILPQDIFKDLLF